MLRRLISALRLTAPNTSGHDGLGRRQRGEFRSRRQIRLSFEPLERRDLLTVVPIGAEFQVNSYTTGSQETFNIDPPAVATDAAGNFVVTWSSFEQDGDSWGIYAQRFNTNSGPLGSEFRVNTYTTGNQIQSSIAMDPSGEFVIAWCSRGQHEDDVYDVYAQRFTPAGQRLGSEFRVNSYTSSNQFQPTVAIDSDGDFAITWYAHNNQDGNNYGVFAQRYNAAGAPQGSEFQVNTYTTDNQVWPTIAMDMDGDFVVTWTSFNQDGSSRDVYAQRFQADGARAGSEFRVNSTTLNHQQASAVAMDANGNFVVSWTSTNQDGSDEGVFAQRFNAAGTPQGSEFRLNSYTSDRQFYSTVAMDADGDFVTTWTSMGQDHSDYGVFAQRYSAEGIAQGSEFQVNSYTTNVQRFSSVGMTAAGDFVVIWTSFSQDGDGGGVFGQRYSANVDIAGEPKVLGVYAVRAAAENQLSPLAPNDREFEAISKLIVVFSEAMSVTGLSNVASSHNWQVTRSGVDITNRITGITFGFSVANDRHEAVLSFDVPLGNGAYELTAKCSLTDLGGNPLDGNGDGSGLSDDYSLAFSIAPVLEAGSEFRVNSSISNDQWFSHVSMSGDGDFVVTWQSFLTDGDGWGIFAQRYDSGGVPSGTEFRVNSYTTGWQGASWVTHDAQGNFLITWSSDGQDGSLDGIYAQRYAATGDKLGSEFRISNFTTGAQHHAAAAFDASGQFIVAWTSDDQDGSSGGVYAQRYNANGLAISSEFRLNTYTTGNQLLSSLAVDDDGNMVAVWLSQDGQGYGVYARRYDAALNPQGAEFLVSDFTTGDQVAASVAASRDGDFVMAWSNSQQDGDSQGIVARRFSSSGIKLGSEFVVNTHTTGSQRAPVVATDADGDFVISWNGAGQDGSDYGVFAQRYNAAGQKIGIEFQGSTYTTSDQVRPYAAMDRDGDFVVTWHSKDQDGSGFGVYAQRYGATAVVSGVQLAETLQSIRPGDRLSHAIPAGASIEVKFNTQMSVVGGASGTASVLNPQNWRLIKNGVHVLTPWPFSSVAYSGNTATLTLNSALGDGIYVLTAKNSLQDATGQALDGDGNGVVGDDFTLAFKVALPTTAGSEFRVNSYTTGSQRTFSEEPRAIASDAAGNFVVVWSNDLEGGVLKRDVYAQRYTAAGLPIGSEFRVNDTRFNDQQDATVAMNAAGDFVIAWTAHGQDGSGPGVKARRYNADGVPLGSEFLVNIYTTNDQSFPSVAMNAAGDFVITWSSDTQEGTANPFLIDSGIYARRYDASGTPLGDEFPVNTFTTGHQRHPTVALDADGDYIVTWMSYEQDGSHFGIYAQQYHATGVPQGSEFRVNSTTSGIQMYSSVAAAENGDFVVTWMSYAQDGSDYGIYAQRYSAAREPLGSEFRVNTYTSGHQQYPAIGLNIRGDFAISWTSVGQDGDSAGVYAQRYNASGVPQGSEFRVSQQTTGAQQYSSMVVDSDGDLIVAWTSDGQDGSGEGVLVRQFTGVPLLQVVSLTPTYTGFKLDFNRDFDTSVLNLYDQGGALGVADVTLIGASTGAVRGSVVIDPGSRRLTFISSGGQLAPDAYTVSLRSSATGLWDTSGNLLDGNGDGFAGDDYSAKFTIAPPPTGVTLGIADFTRGYGQTVNVPAMAATGIPITISNAVGVKLATFALVYDPALLSITGATIGASISGAVSLDTSLVGIARVIVTNGTQLSGTAGAQTLVNLTASVPSTAPYSSKQLLELSSIQLIDTALGTIPAIDDDGIHIAAYFGDANGSQSYNAPDATAAQRLIVGLDTGFAAYQLADPYLIADITGNGHVQSDDVTQIQRAIVGLSTPNIPPHPGLSPPATGGSDPIVSIPKNLTASVGETISVPVEILVTEPTGITLAGADIAIAYDSNTLELTDTDVSPLLIGFGLSVNAITPGVIRLSLNGSPLELPYYASGVLANLQFTVIAGAETTSRVNLLQSAGLQTALYDTAGRALTLSPAPTNGDDDAVDGMLSIPGNERRETVWELNHCTRDGI